MLSSTKKTNVSIKIPAIVGTILIWIPILAPILLAAAFLIKERAFRLDFLMPAELFTSILIGGILAVWASLKAGLHQRLIGWSFGIAVGLVVFSQGLALVTDIFSGDVETFGWRWAVVITAIVIYTLAVIALGVGGILLLRDLFRTSH